MRRNRTVHAPAAAPDAAAIWVFLFYLFGVLLQLIRPMSIFAQLSFRGTLLLASAALTVLFFLAASFLGRSTIPLICVGFGVLMEHGAASLGSMEAGFSDSSILLLTLGAIMILLFFVAAQKGMHLAGRLYRLICAPLSGQYGLDLLVLTVLLILGWAGTGFLYMI